MPLQNVTLDLVPVPLSGIPIVRPARRFFDLLRVVEQAQVLIGMYCAEYRNELPVPFPAIFEIRDVVFVDSLQEALLPSEEDFFGGELRCNVKPRCASGSSDLCVGLGCGSCSVVDDLDAHLFLERLDHIVDINLLELAAVCIDDQSVAFARPDDRGRDSGGNERSCRQRTLHHPTSAETLRAIDARCWFRHGG